MNFRLSAIAGLVVFGLLAGASHAADDQTFVAAPAALRATIAPTNPSAVASVISFDNLTDPLSGAGGAFNYTSSTPNTYMGDTYVLAPGSTSISGFDLAVLNNSGTTYTGLMANIYVWGTVNTGTVSAASPAFSNLLGQYSATFTGTLASSSSTFSVLESGEEGVPGIVLNTPLAVPSGILGITVNFRGTTDGVNYASANLLTSLIANGIEPSVGSDPSNGYYRNAASETNGNFNSGLRSLSGLTNQSIALRVYSPVAAVPEPGTYALMGLGLAALLIRRRARQA